MLVVWLGFSVLFPPQETSAPEQQTAPAQNTAIKDSVEKTSPVVTTAPGESESPRLSSSVESAAVSLSLNAPDREIVIETTKYRATLSSAGARLIAFELKDFRAEADPEAPRVQLINTASPRYATIRTSGSEGFALATNAPHEVDLDSDFMELSAGDSQVVNFRTVTPSGLEVVKAFTFTDGRYSIDLRTAVRNLGQGPLTGGIDLALVRFWDDEAKQDAYTFTGPVTLVGDKLDKVKVKKLKDESPTYGKDAVWTSIQSKYFMSVAVPVDKAVEQVVISRDGDTVQNVLKSAYFTLQPGDAGQFDYFLFFGPKDLDILKAEGHQLDRTIDFGFFEILSKPLLHVLTFFYGYLKNYGLAIILLTIIIKILFWPLTHKSYASMKAMQKLQPEMQKVRERFKSDKERLNKELMELYKKHRVNPLGGCLPMLVQIPVFFALYKVLMDSIALRHAPFALWLTDLSAKDPYYITPVLMGISMFVQQKLTPVSGDPMQARIMTFLPVVFTFMFLNFPSGLVIYWLVNNLLTIVQQVYIHRKA
jgi:YidC/Oxa1 family membrane protein insertase